MNHHREYLPHDPLAINEVRGCSVIRGRLHAIQIGDNLEGDRLLEMLKKLRV